MNATMTQEMPAFANTAVEQRKQTAGRAQQMPLSFLHGGQLGRVVKVRGKGELRQHLRNLGFVEHAAVSVVSEHGGDVIVQIKGTQLALNRSVALNITVEV
ncbi:FeoA family protein [Eggerthellaceae bacterium 3-80]